MGKIKKTEQQWAEQLSEEAFEVTRHKATEAPHSGEYDQFFEQGTYKCICCGAPLFSSEAKFDAGCGWPSFDRVDQEAAIEEHVDESIPGMPRTEVVCHNCDAHLGHVFPDGPTDTKMRYCINSVALDFEEDDKK